MGGSMRAERWTSEQLNATLELYCITHFGKIHSKNPDIINLANQIASLDPTLGQAGMKNVSKLDKIVWDQFFQSFSTSNDEDLSEAGAGANGASEPPQAKFIYENNALPPLSSGSNRPIVSMARNGQDFFRKMIVASYDNQCAVSDINCVDLLVASHIVPWSERIEHRMNPSNGICLSALYDRAFDRGLIAFSDDFHVLFSSRLDEITRNTLRASARQKMRLPTRFLPDLQLLRDHRQHFQGKATFSE
jgi:putative restriction endonuclease